MRGRLMQSVSSDPRCLHINTLINVHLDSEAHLHLDEAGNRIHAGGNEKIFRMTTRQNHVLEPERFGPRTLAYTTRIFHFTPDWRATAMFYKDSAQGIVIPSILWLVLLNGASLGVYLYQASTFAQILMASPYSFQFSWLGYVQAAQIADCLLMVPILGYGSDILARFMARWHKGVFEPEYRLITLIVPTICVIVGCVLYGKAGQYPSSWAWSAIVVPYHLGYFAFLGINLISITYAVDSFPAKAGPLLLLICAGRGFISFGLGYSTVPFIQKEGYDGAMNAIAIVCGVLCGLGIVMFFLGRRIRMWVERHFWRVG